MAELVHPLGGGRTVWIYSNNFILLIVVLEIVRVVAIVAVKDQQPVYGLYPLYKMLYENRNAESNPYLSHSQSILFQLL